MQSTWPLPSFDRAMWEFVANVVFRHRKVARPSDVSIWIFPPGMPDMGSDDDGDGDDDDYDESDLEVGVENLIKSLLH